MERSGRLGTSERGLTPPPHAHILNLPRSEVLGLVESLKSDGMSVSFSGDSCGTPGTAGRLPRGTTLLIHAPEVEREHPARLGALRRGVLQVTPADWLRRSFVGREGVVVVGGRIASLAAAMIGRVLCLAGCDPEIRLRESCPQVGGRFRRGNGRRVVVDWGAEPSTALEAGPRVLLLMEPPCERRGNPTGSGSSPDQFGPGDSPRPSLIAVGHPSGDRVADGPEWLGFRQGCDWWGADAREESGSIRFRVFERGTFAGEVSRTGAGPDDAEAALGAFAVCHRLGVPVPEIRAGLEDFAGLSRDFERRGTYRGVTLVDDSSDELRSIVETLQRARREYGIRRLRVVLAAPRGTGPEGVRRLSAALTAADRVLVVHEEGPREWATGADALERGLVVAGVSVRGERGAAGAISAIDEEIEPGDVLLTIGSGEVGTIADAFIRRLPRDRQAG